MPRRLLAALLALALSLSPAAAQAPTEAQLRAFVRDRLVDAVLMMDRHFRVPQTGQYLDFVRLDGRPARGPSSIAATGLGLVSLALGDALGVIEDAEEKAQITLRHLLGRGAHPGFDIPRSPGGWYPHFVDPLTGAPVNGSEDRFSTIDTALLAAGAAVAARYFQAKSFTSGEGESRTFALAGGLVGRIAWRDAIHSVERGLLHLVFLGEAERTLDGIYANPFDEYVILPCMAMRGEQLAGRTGPAHALFFRHYAMSEDLPMMRFEGVDVISKPSGAFIAHFTHQFAYYYCDALNGQRAFRAALRRLAEADRRHFARKREGGAGLFPPALWGLGAGSEVKFAPDGSVERTGYGVNDLEDNPFDTASPAIMAAFAPLWRYGEAGDPLVDLYRLFEAGTCRYEVEGLRILWRCSARDPSIPVAKLEAVDFSTWILGLAARDAMFGINFFRTFNL